jgi:two-component system, NarL family, response regulator NreC
MTVRVVLADDHTMVRQGLRAILESHNDILVIGEACDGLETISVVQKLKPDVTVLDLMMPKLNGLEVTRQISKLTRVLIVSMHANEAYVLESLRNGAFGYVLKDSNAQELVGAVIKVSQGLRYLSSPLSERAIDYYIERTQAPSLEPYETLTTREREVFQLVAEGLTNNDISVNLNISPRTVEIHKAHAMHKLNLASQIDIVRYAIRHGILPMED